MCLVVARLACIRRQQVVLLVDEVVFELVREGGESCAEPFHSLRVHVLLILITPLKSQQPIPWV